DHSHAIATTRESCSDCEYRGGDDHDHEQDCPHSGGLRPAAIPTLQVGLRPRLIAGGTLPRGHCTTTLSGLPVADSTIVAVLSSRGCPSGTSETWIVIVSRGASSLRGSGPLRRLHGSNFGSPGILVVPRLPRPSQVNSLNSVSWFLKLAA